MSYRIALGPIAGRKTLTPHNPGAVSGARESAKPLTAARDGFSLNAALACKDRERDKLERLCCHISRRPIALERLSIDGDGLVVCALKHPFRDGTTHVCCTWMYECRGRQDAGSGLFESLDFIARLAALVPRPRTHLVRYHGLFAPNAKHRHHVVDSQTSPPAPEHGEDASESLPTTPRPGCSVQRPRVRDRLEILSAASAGPVHVIACGYRAGAHHQNSPASRPAR